MRAVDKICSAFLRQIILRMKDLGLTQTALAKRMNVSRPYVTRVLSGDVNISFKTAARLARALKMDFFPGLKDHQSEGEGVDLPLVAGTE